LLLNFRLRFVAAILFGCLCVGVHSVKGDSMVDLPRSVQDSAIRLTQSGDENELALITTLMAANGYFNPTIRRTGDSKTILPGRRSILSRAELYGDSVYSIPIDAGYSDAVMRSTLQGVVAHWSARGYLYARVILDSLAFSKDSVVAACRLVRGALSVLGEVKLIGLERTSPVLLQRIVNVRAGDTVTTGLIESLEERLAGVSLIRFFRPVEIVPQEGFTAVDLVCRFSEVPQVELFGGIGYLPEDKSGLTWEGRAQLNNLFGTGKALRIDSRRPQRKRSGLDVSYSQPIFYGGIGSWGMSISTRDYVDQFYEFQIRSSWDVQSGRGAILGGEVGWKSVENESVASFSAWSAGARAELKSAGIREVRGQSWRVATEFTSVYRRFRKDSSSAQIANLFDTRARIRLEGFTQLAHSLGIGASAGYQGLQTRDTIVSPSELIFVGGTRSLRGYRTDQFSAVHVVSASLEPGISFSSGRTGLFIDAAWLSSRTVIDRIAVADERIHTGYGWFVRLVGESSSLQFGLAWNPDIQFNEPRLTFDLSSRM
jgi:outer membrane protein assembly factor BamA